MEADGSSGEPAGSGDMNVFRPPLIRSTAALDRALFSKTYQLAAARVNDPRNITKYRKALAGSRELLQVERLTPIVREPEEPAAVQQERKKCLLLRHGISASAPETWGDVVTAGVQKDEIGVIPYVLTLDYDYWSSRDVLSSMLPEEFHDDIPTSFNTAGHVAHLNLREKFLRYRFLVAEVLTDKNPQIKTVINKTATVGTESEFRTFGYEVLAGPDDLMVEVRENLCVYRFDYSKVYWNSKLEKEHSRIAGLCKPGEVLCDVMAGIGPFAIPAAKRGVFVWANDMNPDSFFYLKDSIERNKVSPYVRPFNEDGKAFIKAAADSVLAASTRGECAVVWPKLPLRSSRRPAQPGPEPQRIPVPSTVAHFVMNLPASAIEFLPCYRGLYAGHEDLFAPATGRKLPQLHVHCFAVKSDDDVPKLDICQRISNQLGLDMRLGDPDRENEVAVHYVRAVAPAKSMYCASFRLPAAVAFAKL